ncbi:hypothetical protein [Pseudomonas syringae]|uniref:hypothetical protein n=1 Tax=Pseudomonas syringae TaxID=317 RepID=UPI0027E539DF|nr:hypothetical protein [Pseudomonas syringae]
MIASSVTRSGISGGAVVITDDAEQQKRTGQNAEQTVAGLNRDVSSDRNVSNSLKPIFDEDEVRAWFEIVTAFSNEASTFLANKAREADLKRQQSKELQEQADKAGGLSDTERMLLQNSARQLAAEANDISENWGAGGTYRQITTALIGAAGGNISAGNAAFVQSLVVNYVQQRGAGYIGDLVANGELTEGSPLHAALHGIVACAGAAASNQSCGSGAAGAAASSLLTGLFSQSSPDESEEQREAKRNLIVSLVTGLAATSASIDPTAANTAAGAAVDNNWLATQQEAQARKEYEAAKGLVAKAQVAGKWLAISGKQEILTLYGIGKGLAESSWGDITGLADFAMHPINGLNGLSSLISDPEVRAQLGEDVANKFSARIDTIKNALEVGGDDNAEAMGKAMGELAWQIGTAVTGVGGAASGGVKLAKAGIKVGGEQLEKLAEAARLEKIAKAEAVRNRVVGAIADSQEASASSKFGQFAKTEAELRGAQRVKSATEIPIVKVKTENAVKGTPEYELLNNPSARAANTRYELDNGKSFTTNSAGQVEELTFIPVNEKIPRDSRQTEMGHQGRDTDVGGHAQACSQGGTCDGYNLFPQDKNFNNSAYKVFYENIIKKALDDSTKTVGPTTIKFNR